MAGLKNELSWSFSRHQALQACARRYYFKHYKSWGGWERDCDPAVREIYRLSKLESRPTWQGSVVHRSIARSLQAARMGRPVPEPQAVIDEALGWMRQDYRDSRDDVARRSEDFKRHVRFVEHEYGEDDGSERWRSRWKESADLVAQALNAFFASSHWATLSALKESDWIELDDPAGKVFQSFDAAGVKVNVKIDAAFRENGRPILVDWKTGRRESPATPLQLAAYALYMQQRHGIAPGAIVAREVNLIVGTVKQHDVGPEALEIFHDIMTESVEKMRSLLVNVAENIPKPEGEFAFTQDERECRYCVFRGACPKISAAF